MNNGEGKKDKELTAMAFPDGSIVLHNEQNGFKIEVFDSAMGVAEPIVLSKKDLDKIKQLDLKVVKFEDGVIKEGDKNDSKDIPSPMQDLQGEK